MIPARQAPAVSNLDGSSVHQIARMLRLVENRKCADCSAGLGDSKFTYAQVKFGVWVCKKCAELHNRFVCGDTLMLALSRTWTDDSLEAMSKAGSNIKQNKLLERYSNGLSKATPDCSDDERELWIRCKYTHLFAIPAMSERERQARLVAETQQPTDAALGGAVRGGGAIATMRGQTRGSAPVLPVAQVDTSEAPKKVLPMRLVDYFITVGPAACPPSRKVRSESVTRINHDGTSKEETKSAVPAKPGRPKLTGGSRLSGDIDEIAAAVEKVIAPAKEVWLPPLPACDEVFLPAVIDNCFPDASAYPDNEVPDQAAPFIFPSGLGLSSEERPPAMSTFVLTDDKRVKIFGAALIFYELLEPEELAVLLTPRIPKPKKKGAFGGIDDWDLRPDYDYEKALQQRRDEIASNAGWHLVYAPRALALTGHYAFYNAFTEFLTDIYRTSLSAAPVPIERFVNNFVVETPLPPMGRIEVCVALPSKTLSISRPALNQLPMVDFSYRPLFACLSVDNIVTAFRMICGEFSICFVSKNLALLTPVQEAMLSLLFPLVWQGVYIPVLPKHMLEVLDAPVPIVAGIHSSYISNIPLSHRPAEVLFVDIDNDTIHLGGTLLTAHPFAELSGEFDTSGFADARNAIINFLQEPLPKMFVKLRAKMHEFGGCIYRTNTALALLETAGVPYPLSEHLTPLSMFAMEAGMASRDTSKGGSNGRFTGQAASYSYNGKDEVANSVEPILSAGNNCSAKKWDTRDTFDASELRSAFLRFFVALFIDCDKHQEELDKVLNAGVNNRQSGSRMSIFRTANAIPSTRLEAFYLNLLGTQMYSEFKDERKFNAEMPEIRYFEESIAEKKNRSRFNLTTQSTPFLNSRVDDIAETYTPPTPSVSGLQVGQTFEYSKWPRLKLDNVGPTRAARVLLKGGAEMRRKANKLQVDCQKFSALAQSIYGSRMAEETDSSKSSVNGNINSHDSSSSAGHNQLQNVLEEGAVRYRKITSVISRVQSRIRMRIIRERFLKQCSSIVRIQSIFRSYVCSKRVGGMRVLASLKEQIVHIVRIQTKMRGFVARRKYIRIYSMILWLQAGARAGDSRKKYLHLRSHFHRLSGIMRGFLTRLQDERRRELLFDMYRGQLLLLWKMEHTTLYYRSLFWVMVRWPTYLHLAMLRDELFRLYNNIGLLDVINKNSSLSDSAPAKSSARTAFNPDQSLVTKQAHKQQCRPTSNSKTNSAIDLLAGVLDVENDAPKVNLIDATNSSRLIDAVATSAVWKLVESSGGASTGSDALAKLLGEKFVRRNKIGMEQIKAERDILYKTMKQSIPPAELEQYYKSFDIEVSAKKKKDTVVYHLLFNTNTKDLIDTSASLLMHVHHGKDGHSLAETPRNGFFGVGGAADQSGPPDMFSPTGMSSSNGKSKLYEWFEQKKGERIRAASLETLRVCLKLIAAKKKSNPIQIS